MAYIFVHLTRRYVTGICVKNCRCCMCLYTSYTPDNDSCMQSRMQLRAQQPSQNLPYPNVLRDGLVTTAREVTELTGETWVQASKLYLWCRFHRLPRTYPKVLETLSILLECVKRMPVTGELFTAQCPELPIFIAGMVAVREQDRHIIKDWFDVVVQITGEHSVSIINRTTVMFNAADSQYSECLRSMQP